MMTMTGQNKKITIKEWEKVVVGDEVCVRGWVRTKRVSKRVFFVTLTDGSCLRVLQVVGSPGDFAEELLKGITVGASLMIEGRVVVSPGGQQSKELYAGCIRLLGESPASYPLQPKWHTLPFLRSIQHLRMRTMTFQAVFRLRHGLSHALHRFFNERGFCWLHTPIITSEDAEGAGKVFAVLSEHDGDLEEKTFFGKRVSLTVSGQLEGEAGEMGLNKVYTFAPTFRAENSNTKRHLAEFWMLEPEMAFYTLEETIDVAESCIRYAVESVLREYEDEIVFLEQRAMNAATREGRKVGMPLREQLKVLLERRFVRISYTEAVDVLKRVDSDAYPDMPHVVWGDDLQTLHEQFLTDYFSGGVVVTDYPKGVKAFYMRLNDDGETVAAMDVLLPRVGEVAGGSQREERIDFLKAAMARMGMASKPWYLDTRRYGSVPHSGFGLGFERLLLFVTGMDNIRDVIPFPRTPGSAMG